MFFNPMKLHHSQTALVISAAFVAFFNPMKLHHSQTYDVFAITANMFFNPMKLHHSQTRIWHGEAGYGFLIL